MPRKYIKVDGIIEIPEDMSTEDLIYIICDTLQTRDAYIGAEWKDITEQLIGEEE